jgi:tRNA(adenine34) deaminase
MHNSPDANWLDQVYQLALLAKEKGEVPVAALIVDEANQLIAKSHNQVIYQNDPTAHAEIIVLREAARKLNNYRLLNTTLYVTLEPCAMCAGALVHARVKRVVFACRDFKAGAGGSKLNLLSNHSLNYKIQIDELYDPRCEALLKDFFLVRR